MIAYLCWRQDDGGGDTQGRRNATCIARFLLKHKEVSNVIFPLFGSEKERCLTKDLMQSTGGAVVVFELSGGLQAGKNFIDKLNLIYHVSNIGDSRTLATHPASTTHASVPKETRIAAGVQDGTIRLSVGIENVSDIIDDLAQALESV